MSKNGFEKYILTRVSLPPFSAEDKNT